MDINKLLKGEDVVCPCCNKGLLKLEYGESPETASSFKCNECGKRLLLNWGEPKKRTRSASKTAVIPTKGKANAKF